jgi:hypothetical protein
MFVCLVQTVTCDENSQDLSINVKSVNVVDGYNDAMDWQDARVESLRIDVEVTGASLWEFEDAEVEDVHAALGVLQPMELRDTNVIVTSNQCESDEEIKRVVLHKVAVKWRGMFGGKEVQLIPTLIISVMEANFPAIFLPRKRKRQQRELSEIEVISSSEVSDSSSNSTGADEEEEEEEAQDEVSDEPADTLTPPIDPHPE